MQKGKFLSHRLMVARSVVAALNPVLVSGFLSGPQGNKWMPDAIYRVAQLNSSIRRISGVSIIAPPRLCMPQLQQELPKAGPGGVPDPRDRSEIRRVLPLDEL